MENKMFEWRIIVIPKENEKKIGGLKILGAHASDDSRPGILKT